MRVTIVSSIISAAGLVIASVHTRGSSARDLDIGQISSSEYSFPTLLRRTSSRDPKTAVSSSSPPKRGNTVSSPRAPTPRASQHRLSSSPLTSPITPAQRVPKRKTTSSAQEIPPGKSLSPEAGPSRLERSPGSAQYLHDTIKTERSPSPRSRSPSLDGSSSPPLAFTPGGRALARQGSNKSMYRAYNRFRGDSPGPLGLNPAIVSASDLQRIGLQFADSPPSSRESSPVRGSSSSDKSSSSRQRGAPGSPGSPGVLASHSPDPSISSISRSGAPSGLSQEHAHMEATSGGSEISSPVGRMTHKFRGTGLQNSDRQQSAPF